MRLLNWIHINLNCLLSKSLRLVAKKKRLFCLFNLEAPSLFNRSKITTCTLWPIEERRYLSATTSILKLNKQNRRFFFENELGAGHLHTHYWWRAEWPSTFREHSIIVRIVFSIRTTGFTIPLQTEIRQKRRDTSVRHRPSYLVAAPASTFSSTTSASFREWRTLHKPFKSAAQQAMDAPR